MSGVTNYPGLLDYSGCLPPPSGLQPGVRQPKTKPVKDKPTQPSASKGVTNIVFGEDEAGIIIGSPLSTPAKGAMPAPAPDLEGSDWLQPPLVKADSLSESPLLPAIETPPRATSFTDLNDPGGYDSVTSRQELTIDRLEDIANDIDFVLRRSNGVTSLLGILNNRRLKPKEFTIIFDALQQIPDTRQEIIRRAVKYKDFSDYLEKYGVDRRQMLAEYRPDAHDQIEFYAGYLAGVLKALTYDQVMAVVDLGKLGIELSSLQQLLGRAAFDAEARRELGETFEAVFSTMQQFWRTGISGLASQYVDELSELLADGKHFQAGAKFGNTMMNVGLALREILPKVGSALAKARPIKTVLTSVRSVNAPLFLRRYRQHIKDMIDSIRSGKMWKAPDGVTLEKVGKELVASKDGKPVAKLPWDDVDIEKAIDQALKDDPPKLGDLKDGDVDKAVEQLKATRPEHFGPDGRPVDIEGIVQNEATEYLKDPFEAAQLAPVRGSKIAARVRKVLQKLGLPGDVVIDSEIGPLLDAAKLGQKPPTVEQFLKSLVDSSGKIDQEAQALLDSLSKAQKQITISDLKPDFLHISDTGGMTLLDWVPKPHNEHFAKTLLYFKVYEKYGKKPVTFARVGEIYYGPKTAYNTRLPAWPKGEWEKQVVPKLRDSARQGKSTLYTPAEATNKKNFRMRDFYRRLRQSELKLKKGKADGQ